MIWKILTVLLALMLISSVPDMLNEPRELRHWIGLAFSLVGLIGMAAFAFRLSLLDQRFWFPFALAYGGWLSFGFFSTAVPWSTFSQGRTIEAPTLVVMIGIPLLISFLQWWPVWRYANGDAAD